MSLVWHIVKKDFLRLRVPLAFWALLLVAKGEIGVRALKSPLASMDQLFVFQWLEYTLVPMEAIVCVLLVAALIHEDAVAGASGFWVTRPIAGGRLLAAKLLSAALMFGVLPLAIAMRWWVVCGYDGAEMIRAGLAVADVQTVTVCGALLLAVLTNTISQFLGWVLVLVVALAAWVFGLALIVGGPDAENTHRVVQTRVALFFALAASGGAAVVALQFLTRRRDWALRVAVVTAGLMVMDSVGTWDFSRWWSRMPPPSPLTTKITVAVENAKLEQTTAMDYVLRGVPEDFDVRASADHVWRWSDGAMTAAGSGWALGPWPGAAEWRSLGLSPGIADATMMRAYLTSGPEGAARREALVVPMKFNLRPEMTARLRRDPAAYTGELRAALLQPKLETELPLRAGEGRSEHSYSVRIDRVDWSEGELRLTLAESESAWMTYGRRQPSIATMMENMPAPATGFALVNRARGEAVKLWAGGGRAATLLVGTQELGWRQVRCRVPCTEEEKISGARASWLDGATLAVVRYHEEARFDLEVKIARFGASPESMVTK